MRRNLLAFTVFATLFANAARAEVVFMSGTSVGRTKATTPNGQEPLLLQYGWNLSLSYKWDNFLVGGLTEVRMSEQYSDVRQETGNYKGHYWSQIGPVVGARWEQYLFLADMKLLGKYVMEKRTADGGQIKFTDPLGLRLTMLYELSPMWFVGGHYEYLQFKRLEHSQSGPHNLGSAQKFHQWGLSASFYY